MCNKNDGHMIRDIIFFFIVFSLVFVEVTPFLQMYFLGGVVGGKLVFYPLIIGIIYTIYRYYKYNDFLVKIVEVKRYMAIYLLVVSISLIMGLYNYPYFDLIINAPKNQIDKLPKVLFFLESYGIDIEANILVAVWIILRTIKSLGLELLYTFGGSYMIYCWYKDDWKSGFNVLCKGIMCSLIVIFLYSSVEIFYLAGNELAKKFLENINPYIHVIKVKHEWWPPLLWKNQVRSIFPEPSFFAIWAAFVIPFVWHELVMSESHKNKMLYGFSLIFLSFLIFLTKARTGVALLCGEIVLLFLVTIYLHNRVIIKQFGVVLLCTIIAFGLSTSFINNNTTQRKQVTTVSYMKDNIGSIVSKNKRSNTARYSTIIANIKIGLDHPILGVGRGLTSGYMPKYFPEMAKDNSEVKNWIKYQKEQGILKMGIPSFSAYSLIFAETGFLGLILYMLVPLYLLFNICKKVFCQKETWQYSYMMISLLGMLASGFSNTLNITYCYWVILGLGYAMCFGKQEEKA